MVALSSAPGEFELLVREQLSCNPARRRHLPQPELLTYRYGSLTGYRCYEDQLSPVNPVRSKWSQAAISPVIWT
jgi:hypothetical protein